MEKDLSLKVGDSVYLGHDEWKCVEVDHACLCNLDKHTYHVKRNDIKIWITKDGRTFTILPPIFSREPYDLPEMVYEKAIEIGEMVFAWDEYMIEKKRILIGEYMGKISNSIQMLYMVGKDNVPYRFISRKNPLINENK